MPPCAWLLADAASTVAAALLARILRALGRLSGLLHRVRRALHVVLGVRLLLLERLLRAHALDDLAARARAGRRARGGADRRALAVLLDVVRQVLGLGDV